MSNIDSKNIIIETNTKCNNINVNLNNDNKDNNKTNSIQEYIVVQRIGSGSFSQVFKAYHQSTPSQYVAIKSISREKIDSNPQIAINLDREIKSMQLLSHDNVIKFLEVIQGKRHIYLILEYCNGGDLHKTIRSLTQQHPHRKLSEEWIRFVSQQFISGLGYLHEHSIVHRDFKPHNLLLHYNNHNNNNNINSKIIEIKEKDEPKTITLQSSLSVKLADFGFARILDKEEMAQSMFCSPLYAAPELLNAKHYDHRIDLWSLGIVLYELATGHPPFRAKNFAQLLQEIFKLAPKLKEEDVALQSLSPHLKDLILNLLQIEPKKRFSCVQVLNHPFYNQQITLQTRSNLNNIQIKKELIITTTNIKTTLSPTRLSTKLFLYSVETRSKAYFTIFNLIRDQKLNLSSLDCVYLGFYGVELMNQSSSLSSDQKINEYEKIIPYLKQYHSQQPHPLISNTSNSNFKSSSIPVTSSSISSISLLYYPTKILYECIWECCQYALKIESNNFNNINNNNNNSSLNSYSSESCFCFCKNIYESLIILLNDLIILEIPNHSNISIYNQIQKWIQLRMDYCLEFSNI